MQIAIVEGDGFPRCGRMWSWEKAKEGGALTTEEDLQEGLYNQSLHRGKDQYSAFFTSYSTLRA